MRIVNNLIIFSEEGGTHYRIMIMLSDCEDSWFAYEEKDIIMICNIYSRDTMLSEWDAEAYSTIFIEE